MKRDFVLVVFVVKWFEIVGIVLYIVFHDEVHFLEVLLKEGAVVVGEDGLAIKHEVIAFNVELIGFHSVGITIKVVFDNKGHVRKGQVDVVTEDNPVVCILINPISKVKGELSILHIEIRQLDLIASQLASWGTAVDPVSLNNEETSILVLKGQRFCINVEGIDLPLVNQVPIDDAVLEGGLSDSDNDPVRVTPASHSLNEGLLLILWDVNGKSIDDLGLKVECPDYSQVPEEHVLSIHGAALQIVELIILAIEVKELLLVRCLDTLKAGNKVEEGAVEDRLLHLGLILVDEFLDALDLLFSLLDRVLVGLDSHQEVSRVIDTVSE